MAGSVFVGQGGSGEPGPKGDPGYTPIKGVDYFDGVNGRDGTDGRTPVKGVDYFDGTNGADGRTPVKGVDYFDGAPGAKGDKGDTGDPSTVPGPQGAPGSPAPTFAALANGTTAMGFGSVASVQITATATQTWTTTVPPAGTTCVLAVITSGTTSRTITFGAGFRSVPTLATGTTSARVFYLTLHSNGTYLYQTARTAAMVA